MHDQPENSRVDFGNFQLNYDITPSSDFAEIEYIDENYVATLRFTTPGAIVSVVLTVRQLEYWCNYFELSATRGGTYMEALPIMCARKEDMYLYVRAYDDKLVFKSGTMTITIGLADCLNEFASFINEICCKLDEKENRW